MDIIFNELTASEQELLMQAKNVLKNAHAPYSNYSVGAAILTSNGHIFCGANMENASYGLTSCAEIGAIQTAISAGEKSFEIIAIVVSSPENSGSPCGRCRQVIYEFSQIAGKDITIILGNHDLNIVKKSSIREMLPLPFGPNDLKEK